MKKDGGVTYIFLHIIIPLFIGGSIYVLFRSTNLLMFYFFIDLGIGDIVNNLRAMFSNLKNYLNLWVIYSLPNSLWLYSFYSFWHLLWKKEERVFIILLLTTFLLSIISEVLQYNHILIGVFSWDDIFFIVLSLIAFVLFHLSYFKKSINVKVV